jgi:branched-chain amino acid transport system ATP-binding protein
MFLHIEKVSVSYGKIQALREISLHLDEGEIVAIIGANGAGKSTLINTVSGIVKPAGGKIFFREEEISGLPACQIARKGIVQIPEGRKVFPKLSIMENMELGAFPEKNVSAVQTLIEEMFVLFPILKERKNQAAGTLSGGEQQMLAIARGLMARPKILMFDEPSMGLAPIIVEKVFQIIKDINKRGISLLLVEQNAKKTLNIATRAYVLETGTITLSDTGKNLLENEQIKKAYLGR